MGVDTEVRDFKMLSQHMAESVVLNVLRGAADRMTMRGLTQAVLITLGQRVPSSAEIDRTENAVRDVVVHLVAYRRVQHQLNAKGVTVYTPMFRTEELQHAYDDVVQRLGGYRPVVTSDGADPTVTIEISLKLLAELLNAEGV